MQKSILYCRSIPMQILAWRKLSVSIFENEKEFESSDEALYMRLYTWMLLKVCRFIFCQPGHLHHNCKGFSRETPPKNAFGRPDGKSGPATGISLKTGELANWYRCPGVVVTLRLKTQHWTIHFLALSGRAI